MTIISNGPLEFNMMASPEVTTFSLVISAVPQARVEQEGQLPATHLPELKGRRVPLGKRSLCPWSKEPMGTLVTFQVFMGNFIFKCLLLKVIGKRNFSPKGRNPQGCSTKHVSILGYNRRLLVGIV